ncbi:Down syndrome cell adhesion molecule-like protein Dscam2 [Eumeta japonica]|uniref:Down syndrome cell adhesion molecule-like protein Dscam2 n=1 Tax=Eumeta variegata TaxID=151549 RepID=A0A4C1XQ02_EUMVA|nr:Down syndrome cell adhesion molecule-like protein Dscam2 [Eumeta japonica]
MKQRSLVVFGLVAILVEYTLTMINFQGLITELEVWKLHHQTLKVNRGQNTFQGNSYKPKYAPARISSFGGVAVGTAGEALSIRCVVGGAPPPAKRWLRAGAILHPRPPFYMDGDALVIKGLELFHADNYTCVAENPHGSDSVTWRMIVLKPPAPPTLALLEARPRDLQLELRPPPRVPGHALPKGYTLHWRLAAPEGEWRVQPATPGPVTLTGLRCGSPYRAYCSAGGAPGAELAMRTSGGPPSAPPDTRWIRTNATHAKFDTSVWSDGSCGPVGLHLKWAGADITGARDVPVGGEVILGGLMPGSRYRIAARASNEAGSTKEVYEFTTTLLEGGFAEEVDAPFPATAGELAILLALCAALSLAALTILTILVRRKSNECAQHSAVLTELNVYGMATAWQINGKIACQRFFVDAAPSPSPYHIRCSTY